MKVKGEGEKVLNEFDKKNQTCFLQTISPEKKEKQQELNICDGLIFYTDDNNEKFFIKNINLNTTETEKFEESYKVDFSCIDKNKNEKNICLTCKHDSIKELLNNIVKNKYLVVFSVNNKPLYIPAKPKKNYKIANNDAKIQNIEAQPGYNSVDNKKNNENQKKKSDKDNISSNLRSSTTSSISKTESKKVETEQKEKNLEKTNNIKPEEKKENSAEAKQQEKPAEKKQEEKKPEKKEEKKPEKKEEKKKRESLWDAGFNDLTKYFVKVATGVLMCASLIGVFAPSIAGIIFVGSLILNWFYETIVETIQSLYKFGIASALKIGASVKTGYNYAKNITNVYKTNKEIEKAERAEEIKELTKKYIAKDIAKKEKLAQKKSKYTHKKPLACLKTISNKFGKTNKQNLNNIDNNLAM